MRCVFKKKIM